MPLAACLALLAALAVLLPRWRRRARAQALGTGVAPTLSAADSARLDADLRRFDLSRPARAASAHYMCAGALTPSRSRQRAIVRSLATHRAIR